MCYFVNFKACALSSWTNVFLSPSKLATHGVSSPTILTYNLLRVFFKETISVSNYKGGVTAGYRVNIGKYESLLTQSFLLYMFTINLIQNVKITY